MASVQQFPLSWITASLLLLIISTLALREAARGALLSSPLPTARRPSVGRCTALSTTGIVTAAFVPALMAAAAAIAPRWPRSAASLDAAPAWSSPVHEDADRNCSRHR